jgi:hypothetical protein
MEVVPGKTEVVPGKIEVVSGKMEVVPGKWRLCQFKLYWFGEMDVCDEMRAVYRNGWVHKLFWDAVMAVGGWTRALPAEGPP